MPWPETIERTAPIFGSVKKTVSPLRSGETVFFTLPKIGAVKAMVSGHGIHHRGQLSVYLRLNDIPVPSIYGPSADESVG